MLQQMLIWRNTDRFKTAVLSIMEDKIFIIYFLEKKT